MLGLLLVSGVLAQEKPEKPTKNAADASAAAVDKAVPPKNKAEVPITADREAAVMTFVQQNHAELKELLAHLRENRRKDYERAIRELSRDAERIGQLKDRDGKQ